MKLQVKVFYCLVISSACMLSMQAISMDYRYTAKLENQAVQQGAVKVGSIKWVCKQKECHTVGPWPTPGINACSQLAAIQGTIKEYGHPNKKLDAEGLAMCNKNAHIVTASNRGKSPITSNGKAPEVGGTSAKGIVMPPTAMQKNGAAKASGGAMLSVSPALIKKMGTPVDLGKSLNLPGGVTKGTEPPAKGSATRYLTLEEKFQLAGVRIGAGVTGPIRIDARNAYNGQYRAGFVVYNGTHDPFNNRYVIRPSTQSGGHEAFRSTEIFWRANKDTRYLLDCVLDNLTGRPFIASVHQTAPATRPIGSYQNPENLAVIVPAAPRSGDVQLSLFLSKVGRDANPAFVAVELKGCEIQPID